MQRKRFWIALILFSLIGQIAWVVENMYFNVFIYHMFNASQSEIALMVQASAVAATLTTLLIGAASDRVGKRKAFITVGYLLWGISILVFAALRVDWIAKLFPAAAQDAAKAAAIGVTLVIVFDCVMMFFGSTANDACFNAWLTDSTDETNRGKAEGINAMMPLMAILVVFGGTMWIDKKDPAHWTLLFLVIGGVVLVSGALGFFLIDESRPAAPVTDGYIKTLFYGFRPRIIRTNPDLYLSLICFTIFGISIQVFMPYLILYYTEALHLDNYVLIMAPAILLAAAVTAFYGRLYDRLGYRKTLIPGTGRARFGLCVPLPVPEYGACVFGLASDDVRVSLRHGGVRRAHSRLHAARHGGQIPGASHHRTGADPRRRRSRDRQAGSQGRGNGEKRRRHVLFYSKREHLPLGGYCSAADRDRDRDRAIPRRKGEEACLTPIRVRRCGATALSI